VAVEAARNRLDCSADIGRSWTRQVRKGRSVPACNQCRAASARTSLGLFIPEMHRIRLIPITLLVDALCAQMARLPPNQNTPARRWLRHLRSYILSSLVRKAMERARTLGEARRSLAAECNRTPCTSVRESLAWSSWRTTNLPPLISIR
jgi:hypothetical protein